MPLKHWLKRSAKLYIHRDGCRRRGTLHREVDFLAAAQQTLWQVLPLGPVGTGNSPYSAISAFAGNPLLVQVPGAPGDFPPRSVDYPRVIAHKQELLRRATAEFVPDEGYLAFTAEQEWWLEDYALFMALKHAHGGVAWVTAHRGRRK